MDTGKEKVKKICDLLRKETLEPAQEESAQMIKAAQEKASQIIQEAKVAAEKIKQEALAEREKEKSLLQSSLNQACRQSLDFLKEEIEKKLFSQELEDLLKEPLQQPKVIASFIQAVVEAVEKGGIEADLEVMVPKAVTAEQINACLAQNILKRLKNQSVFIGPMEGGISVKVVDNHMMIDMTDSALKDLVAGYVRQDFRHRVLQG